MMREPLPKVLILSNKLMHYRVPILELIAEKVDLTFACEYDGPLDPNWNFKVIRFSKPRQIGPIIFNRENIHKLARRYDVVIALGTITWLKYMFLPWYPKRNYRVIFWGIGVSASLSKHFDENRQWDWLRGIFFKRADANIYYTSYPVKKNLQRGFKAETLFVANNTVKVLEPEENVKKDSLLFIGTLYQAKGIQVLLKSYREAILRSSRVPALRIIGKGPEEGDIRQWIEDHHLGHSIHMLGPIYNDALKREYIQKAFACISPYQAGLSVLESMGYGTPFVTMKNAITGGEIFNITDQATGCLLTDEAQFTEVIVDIADNPAKYENMGIEARNYYVHNRTPQMMANGVLDAINYVLSNQPSS